MTSLFVDLLAPPWAWIVGGFALVAAEIAAPGVFLLWLGLAAIGTGLVQFALAAPWQAQLMIFAAFALVSVAAGRSLTRRRPSTLNSRGHALVGREYQLDEAIVGGVGRLRLSDTSWRLSGPDAPAGTRVRVVALDGTTLVVVPA